MVYMCADIALKRRTCGSADPATSLELPAPLFTSSNKVLEGTELR